MCQGFFHTTVLCLGLFEEQTLQEQALQNSDKQESVSAQSIEKSVQDGTIKHAFHDP